MLNFACPAFLDTFLWPPSFLCQFFARHTRSVATPELEVTHLSMAKVTCTISIERANMKGNILELHEIADDNLLIYSVLIMLIKLLSQN